MNPKALSPDGYIIGQNLLGDLRYGLLGSDRNGCGWISCYNALKMLGDPRPAEEIAADFQKGLLFGGLLGTNVLALVWYLSREGHQVHVSLFPPHFERLARGAGANILMYWHKRGAHFAAFQREGGLFHFYNAAYGNANDLQSLPEFLRRHSILPVAVLISADDPKRILVRRARSARRRLGRGAG